MPKPVKKLFTYLEYSKLNRSTFKSMISMAALFIVYRKRDKYFYR